MFSSPDNGGEKAAVFGSLVIFVFLVLWMAFWISVDAIFPGIMSGKTPKTPPRLQSEIYSGHPDIQSNQG